MSLLYLLGLGNKSSFFPFLGSLYSYNPWFIRVFLGLAPRNLALAIKSSAYFLSQVLRNVSKDLNLLFGNY